MVVHKPNSDDGRDKFILGTDTCWLRLSWHCGRGLIKMRTEGVVVFLGGANQSVNRP